MQTFDWSDYSALNTSDNVIKLKLSEQEQAFLLALLVSAQDRYAWPEINDTDWDTVDAFLSNLDRKILELI